MVDEVLRVDPKTGKALEARMARGVQAVEELGDAIVVHYVDENHVLRRIEIPRSEVATGEGVDVEKLKEAIARRVSELRARKERAKMLMQLLGYRVE